MVGWWGVAMGSFSSSFIASMLYIRFKYIHIYIHTDIYLSIGCVCLHK